MYQSIQIFVSGNSVRISSHTQAVVDTVILGDKKLAEIKTERDRIYSLPEMTEEDGIKVADLEVRFELDGYSAESRACEILSGQY